MSRRLSLILVALAACGRDARVDSCDDSLAGVWHAPNGERWMLLDSGATLEAYPMFDDTASRDDSVVVAPRVLDLKRGPQLAGQIRRRYMRRAAVCEARADVVVVACRDNQLELDTTVSSAPLGFEPCNWAAPAPHRELWLR